MTKDEIMVLAKKVGLTGLSLVDVGYLGRFADLVVAAEREACADILDRNADRCDPYSIAFDVLDSNAKAIRSRGQK